MFGLEVYGIDEEDNQLLKNPHGICANSRGDVYVADTGNHRIVLLIQLFPYIQKTYKIIKCWCVLRHMIFEY